MKHWDELPFFNSGEWQVIQERLDDLDLAGKVYNPSRENLFAALDACPFEGTKVMFMGQDPYPNHRHATGIAFSVPIQVETLPVTLLNVLKEYTQDTGHPFPNHGNLRNWCDEGVLLWNAIPTCLDGLSLSHQGWFEWEFLTKEIVEALNVKDCVFIFSGRIARRFSKYVASGDRLIEVSHPSPRGSLNSSSPFVGSRIFTTANAKLKELGQSPVNWLLT